MKPNTLVFTFKTLALLSALAAPLFSRAHSSQEVRAANRALVQSCFERSPSDAVREVNEQLRYVCENRPGRHSDSWRTRNTRYRIWKSSSQIHVGLHLRFRIKDTVSNTRAAEMLQQARDCVPVMRSVWARYGILFDLDMDSNRSKRLTHLDHEVDLLDEVGRSDTGNFYARSNITLQECIGNPPAGREEHARSFCETFIRNGVCITMLHETGHFLGLPDEYLDPACPARSSYVETIKSFPWSFMNKRAIDIEDNEFFPRHIEAVLKPLCR